MRFEPSFLFTEFFLFWGTAAVGTLSVLFTVCFNKKKDFRSFAVFNLVCFLFTTVISLLVLDQIRPSYHFFYSLRTAWIPFNGWNIILYVIFTDLLFYFYHYLTHAIPILWIGHYAHHSGTKLHPSLIIRDSILSQIFVLPISLLGIPIGFSPVFIFLIIKLITFYQGFLHFYVTRDIPILSYIFITPYNHIIHHSIKFEGSGQNFGGILCVWDRIFGTYRSGAEYLLAFGIPNENYTDSLWTINLKPLLNLFYKMKKDGSIKAVFKFKKINFMRNKRLLFLYSFYFILLCKLSYMAILK